MTERSSADTPSGESATEDASSTDASVSEPTDGTPSTAEPTDTLAEPEAADRGRGADSRSSIDGLYGATVSSEAQRRALLTGEVPVAVYGLGKMGLPIAAAFAEVTGNVIGADVDPEVVDSVAAGECHVTGEPGLAPLVADCVAAGSLRAVSDPRVAATEASLHVVIVPTLLTESNGADLSIVEAVVDAIATGIDPGDTVLVESTVPPTTCADRIAPRLAERSGLEPDAFGVAFCPERSSSGRALYDIREAYPKVVGGVDDESTRVAGLVYGELTANEVVPVRDATTAEATKVFGGVYRDVNIALANEFARYADAMGIDVREAFEASNTQPYSNILSPGPGVGGHCIPVYPYFLLEEFPVHSPLVRTARAVNDSMPAYTVSRLRDALSSEGTTLEDANVLVLGVTYYPGVNEVRNSPAIEVVEWLARFGARIDVCDPIVDDLERFPAMPVTMGDAAESEYDAVVVVTPHEEFDGFDWGALNRTVVLDCHAALDLEGTDHRVESIGRAQRTGSTGSPRRTPSGSREDPATRPGAGKAAVEGAETTGDSGGRTFEESERSATEKPSTTASTDGGSPDA